MRREILTFAIRQLCVAICVWCIAGSAWASSGATFTLGLSAEYLSDSQEYAGVSATRSNLQTVLWAAVAGHLVDPRFMTFDASVAKTLSNQTISGAQDNKVDNSYYDGSLRFFNNRAISFEVGAGRQGTDVTGLQQGAIVDGVRDYQRYALRALGGNWFRLNLRHWEQSFTADQPDTLRDDDTSWSELSTQAEVGKVDALLQLLWKENNLFGGGLQQEIGTGRVDIDINRTGRVYWHTDLIGNVYRSAQEHGEFSPWTTNYLVRNQLRHRYSQLGFWDLRADLRVVRFESDPVEEVITGNASASVVAPLSPSTFLEGELGYLSNEFGDGLRLSQPRAVLGVRWGQQFGRWWLSLYPRVTYLQADPESFEQESAFGSLVFGSVRYQLPRSSVTFEAEYFDNQLSIPDYSVGEPPIGSAFLAGLDRQRYRGRLIFEYRPTRRTAFFFDCDYRNRVRVDRGLEIEENVARAQLNIVLGRVTIGASADRFEMVGSEVPTLTDVWQANISWGPTYWLLFDGFVRSEERKIFDYVGKYDFAELGMRFNYAKLSFYARVREQRTEEAGLEQRRFRRVWVGVRRLFNFRVGDNQR
jgi:hypothetical protein